jgi:bacterial/archaeal transporter family-2 protein
LPNSNYQFLQNSYNVMLWLFSFKKLSMKLNMIYIVAIFLVGTLLPIQSGVNSKLAKSIANPLTASLISVAVGFIVLGIYVLATKQFYLNLSTIGSQPKWIWIGGIIGVLYVCSLIIIVPKLGSTLSFSILILGQLIVASLIDHYGWFGFPVFPFSIKKIVGILLIAVGIFLNKL